MKSNARPIVGFSLLAVVLIGFAYFSGSVTPQPSPVNALPVVRAKGDAELPPSQAAPPSTNDDNVARLMQEPSLSDKLIAFRFAGEIWTVPREGGDARRIVTGQLRNSRPVFSPDGSQIAFAGTYDGNMDVYVVPTSGGEPHRVTYNPSWDLPVTWSRDGKKLVIESMRATPRDLPKLFSVPVQGGLPEELPLPSGAAASYSPDGKSLAYVPFEVWQWGWKKYRGGQTTPIWIADLSDSHVTKIPREGSNDRFPMWSGDTVYFVSDRNGPFTLFAYDTKTLAVREVVHNPDGFDVRSASAGPGGIVYETLGALHLYDFASGKSRDVKVRIADELIQARPHLEKIAPPQILTAAISPTGKRVLFSAHGEILSAPVEKGDARNLTRSPAVADRSPSWSPDGKWIAWLSDESGEYALYIRAPDGIGPVRKVDLGKPPSFFYAPLWSPDSKKIAIEDKRLNLWLVDLEHPQPQKVDTLRYEGSSFHTGWSPDSRFVVYTKELTNHLHAAFVYSLDEKKVYEVTDGRSDVGPARFDRGGKYLYFIASTDVGLSTGGGEMTSMGHPQSSSVYAAVLQKDQASPVAPESDEEPDGGAPGGKGEKSDWKKDKMRIDFEGIDQRIVALPIERANYQLLEAGTEGSLFVLSAPVALADEDYLDRDEEGSPLEAFRYDMKTRKTEKVIEKIDGPEDDLNTFQVSADGSKILYAADKKWFVVAADKPAKLGEGLIKADLEVDVDPRAEWRQMFHEIWRIERDFLYDPNAHGLDLAAAEKLYAPFVDGIAARSDLNALFEEMLSNLVLGHVWASGGSFPKQDRLNGGLLGADYKIEQGRYRFARILSGENWNPKLRAPLTHPGVIVKEGEFLLGVNGKDLRGDDDVDRLFIGRAGKQTVITVGPNANGGGSRQVTVVPVGSDGGLRLRTWMEDSRKKVDELSKGRVAYVFIPDTHAGGFTNFNRYYFSQVGKDAVILDERFNHGGYIADYIVNLLALTPLMGATSREGSDDILPTKAIFGPKVMIANQMSGSGGDALPWLFKKAKLGTLVGVRTWGGLVGIGGYPQLIDGGRVTAPRWGLYGTTGDWEVENHGIAPDVEVEQDPALIRQGHDPQLERAVQIALDALVKNPPPKLVRPPYPNYGPRLPKAL